jgi:hypothetical protein
MRRLQVVAAVATLLGLLIALVQFADSKAESEEQEKFRTVIVALMHQVIKNTERELNIRYIAQRTVILREAPNHKSRTIVVIPKGDEVRLIKRKHKWIFVEYVQDSDAEPLYGWVDKKYLRIGAVSR